MVSQNQVDHAANRAEPEGYTLWSSYPSKKKADQVKRDYGCPSDIISAVPGFRGWFALYGRAA